CVGAFILQCKRLDFHYCDWAGSSKGMNIFLRTALTKFAAANPQIEMVVSPRPNKHPVIIGHYINGREKRYKAELLRDASGEKLKKVTKPVKSINESVRGVWSPYHGGGIVIRV
ncbi:mitochondrial ribosomal protein-like protein subunit L51, partial [Bisporella sp. PMI_857]